MIDLLERRLLTSGKRVASSLSWLSLLLGLAATHSLGCGHIGINLEDEDSGSHVVVDDEPPPDEGSTDEDHTDKDYTDETTDDEPTDDEPTDDEPTDDEPTDDEPTDDEPTDVDAAPSDPRDAGTDGGPRRPTSDGGRNGSLDGSTDEPDAQPPTRDGSVQPEPERDAEPGVIPIDPYRQCAPDCLCEVDLGCNLDCKTEQCAPTCESLAFCRIGVGSATTTTISCGEGATCETHSALAEDQKYVCEGSGECHVACGDAASCALECVGTGKCVLDCGNALECSLSCGESAHCFKISDDRNTGEFSCPTDARTECSGTLTACNADCPEPDALAQ